MVAQDLIRTQLTNIPGFAWLQNIGWTILLIALLYQGGKELYRLAIEGRCDILTPVLRVLFAAAILKALPWIGTTVADIATYAGRTMADEQYTRLFVDAYAHAVGSTSEYSTTSMLVSLLSPKAWFSVLSIGLCIGMMLIK